MLLASPGLPASLLWASHDCPSCWLPELRGAASGFSSTLGSSSHSSIILEFCVPVKIQHQWRVPDSARSRSRQFPVLHSCYSVSGGWALPWPGPTGALEAQSQGTQSLRTVSKSLSFKWNFWWMEPCPPGTFSVASSIVNSWWFFL